MLAQLGFFFSDAQEVDGATSGGIGWSQVLAFGLVIMVMALMPKIIRKIRRERTALVREETRDIENRPNIRSQADKILVDLAEISREINAQTDTKIRVLNKLIRDSEEIINRYEKLVERGEKIAGLKGSQLESESAKIAGKAEEQIRQVAGSVESAGIQRVDSDIESNNAEIDRSTVENEVSGIQEDVKAKDSCVWQVSMGNKIEKLYKEGRDINEIARKMRLSVSEVTLMLNILKNKS